MALHQTTIFDLQAARDGKERGMERAGQNPARKPLLIEARYLARKIAAGRPERTATADDVQAAMIARGHDPNELGPAAGSLFRGPEWEWTGAWVQSERKSNHCRMLRVWRLVGRTDDEWGPSSSTPI